MQHETRNWKNLDKCGRTVEPPWNGQLKITGGGGLKSILHVPNLTLSFSSGTKSFS